MKISNLLEIINREEFKVSESQIAGEDVILIQPEISAHWNKDNLIFRSSVWTKEGELISAGFPKFFNYGEQFELSPPPQDISNAEMMEKLDGSLLICSKYKGQMILRTRGTFDAHIHDNGKELELLSQRYPKLFNFDSETWNYSVLIEWVSPQNQIILKYSEIDFYLIGIVKHEDYSLVSQNDLDTYASEIGMKRPRRFHFKALPDLLETIKQAKSMEGVVIYTKLGQTLHKLKSVWYLSLHRMKSLLGSFEKVFDVWISFGKPMNYKEFYDKMVETFDYEIAEQCKDMLREIVEIGLEVKCLLVSLEWAIKQIQELPTKKEQALHIQKIYKDYQTIMFLWLNGKEISDKAYKNLYFMIKEKYEKDNKTSKEV
jgi:hypothetical protein